jgi:hypothetical protein
MVQLTSRALAIISLGLKIYLLVWELVITTLMIWSSPLVKKTVVVHHQGFANLG